MMRWLFNFIMDGLNPERREASDKAETVLQAFDATLSKIERDRADAIRRLGQAKATGCTQDVHHASATVERLTVESLRVSVGKAA